jgi:hypothetical protein
LASPVRGEIYVESVVKEEKSPTRGGIFCHDFIKNEILRETITLMS